MFKGCNNDFLQYNIFRECNLEVIEKGHGVGRRDIEGENKGTEEAYGYA